MVKPTKDMGATTDYQANYDCYWRLTDSVGESSDDVDRISELIVATCSVGRVLDVGSGGGLLVASLLRRGWDACGVDVSEVVTALCNRRMPSRFAQGSVLALPFEDDSFEILISTNCLECLALEDVPNALKEIHRVAERFVFLKIATAPDCDGPWRLTVENRSWWEARSFAAGFRKHPLYYRINSYDSLNRDDRQIFILLEKLPSEALKRFDLNALTEERLLHSDMLRETGRRSDAHCIRYYKAAEYIRPGDRVLDVACGLGYGSHILFRASRAGSVLGVDSSEFAIEYAKSHYQKSESIEFVVGDAQRLDFVPDHSIDFIAGFETIEHVEDPIAYLRELKRVLKPAGRVMVCAPNEWVDETGKDPNPHHLHVYTWERLVAEVGAFFLLEQGIVQIAGGALKCPNGDRSWVEFPVDRPPDVDSEWVLLVAMADPVAGKHVPYLETTWSVPDSPEFHVAAFGRDYDNPWLVKGMVAMGFRMRSTAGLVNIQERVLATAEPESVDYAAALCGRIYSHMTEEYLAAAVIKGIESEVWRYASLPAPSPHQLRWQVSLLFAAGELAKKQGRANAAIQFFTHCAERDVLPYSPLLGNKTLDALYFLAVFSLGHDDRSSAKNYLSRSLTECRRLITHDWLNAIGNVDCPLAFGFAELTQLLDKASRAAYLLNDIHEGDAIQSVGVAGFFEQQIRDHKEWVLNLANECKSLLGHLSVRDGQLADLNQAVADRDGRLTELNQAVADRDGRLTELNQAVADRDGRLTELNQVVADRDGRLAELNRVVADHDGHLAELNGALADRDRKIANLNQMVAERDYQLDLLRNEAHSLFVRLNHLFHSRSWQLTRPLRAVSRLVKHGHPFAEGNRAIYDMAARIGRKFPFPLGLKARVRSALLERIYPTEPGGLARKGEVDRPTFPLFEHVDDSRAVMRPECCGLIEGLVSVVLPVYNQANLIAESIESVLNQSHQNFELIIINDGSSDGVEAVLELYKDHPKVRCFTQANQRLPKALSNGFDFARGEFWTWTSADNIMEPRMLEMLVGKLRAEPGLGMTFADYYAIDDRGNLLLDPTWRAHNRPDPASGEIRLPHTTEVLNVVQDNFIGPCFMYRGWIGRCLRDYDPQLGVEDYDYWMRINAFFPVRHLGDDSLLYRYRVHDNTLSAKAYEHNIFEKAQRLMAYEKERAAFYGTPLDYLADSCGRSWLRAQGVPDQEIDSFGGGVNAKELAVINSESAEKNISKLLDAGRPVAVIVNRSDASYNKLARLFNGGLCIALACDKESADRVKLLSSSCPVIDASSVMALNAVHSFAKNLLFIRATRSAEELNRQMPCRISVRVMHHVVLQVDSFTQGGMENVVIDLALSLKSSGYDVTIVNFGKSGDAAEKAMERGLRVISLSGDLSDEAYRSWLLEQKVDLVNAHYSIRGATVCSSAKIPFIQTIHNSYVWLDPVQIDNYRSADNHTAQYICVSMTAARYADVVLGLNVSKMRVVPNGIDPNAIDTANFEFNRANLRRTWGVDDETPIYLNVASIMATKAQLPLVKAFSKVVDKVPEARLVLLGAVMEAPYQAAIEKAVRELGLQKNVLFAGYDRQVSRYYHASDVFVLPSYWEGWSLSLGEAMANGLSCVITDVGSAYEFEGFSNVEIVEPPFGDITSLNYRNLGEFVYGEDLEFESRLAESMINLSVPRRSPINIHLAERIDRDIAYQKYSEIFSEKIKERN